MAYTNDDRDRLEKFAGVVPYAGTPPHENIGKEAKQPIQSNNPPSVSGGNFGLPPGIGLQSGQMFNTGPSNPKITGNVAQAAPPTQNIPNASFAPTQTSVVSAGNQNNYTSAVVPSGGMMFGAMSAGHGGLDMGHLPFAPPSAPGGTPSPQQPPQQPPQQAVPPNWYDRLWGEVENTGGWMTGNHPSMSPELQQAYTRILSGLGGGGGGGGGGGFNVDDLPEEVKESMRHAVSTSRSWLDNPSRYDTELFNSILDSTYSRMNQAQENDRLRLLRDSMRRLGPNSGQLTNEFIDLAHEYDRGRNDFALNLAREAALTQHQDRMAAMDAFRGAYGDQAGSHWNLQSARTQAAEAAARAAAAERANAINALIAGYNIESGLRSEGRQREQDRLRSLLDFGRVDMDFYDRARDDYRWEREHELDYLDRINRWFNDQDEAARRWAEIGSRLPGRIGGEAPGGGAAPPQQPYSPSVGGRVGGGGSWYDTPLDYGFYDDLYRYGFDRRI